MPKLDKKPGDIRRFRGVTVFDWDSEPSTERPSEFFETCMTGDAWEQARGGRSTRREGGFGALWMGLGVVAATAAAGLFGLAHFLRG